MHRLATHLLVLCGTPPTPHSMQGRIQEVDLRDTANVMSSPKLLEWAQQNGLWSPAKGRFNWCAWRCFFATQLHRCMRVQWL